MNCFRRPMNAALEFAVEALALEPVTHTNYS